MAAPWLQHVGGDDMASLIVETANAIGADPVDLATVISYETAGTFDPLQRGPSTQWGQHRGLIQFGEPQARQYGVDWDNPLRSQLGADGAVARYFRANGYQPGMGMLDLYSTVNAGAPGLYSRSDANNGGAPGTVADKVNEQMAGHRRKAEALLGAPASRGRNTPQMAPQAAPVGPTTPPMAVAEPMQSPQWNGNALASYAPAQVPQMNAMAQMPFNYSNALDPRDFMIEV